MAPVDPRVGFAISWKSCFKVSCLNCMAGCKTPSSTKPGRDTHRPGRRPEICASSTKSSLCTAQELQSSTPCSLRRSLRRHQLQDTVARCTVRPGARRSRRPSPVACRWRSSSCCWSRCDTNWLWTILLRVVMYGKVAALIRLLPYPYKLISYINLYMASVDNHAKGGIPNRHDNHEIDSRKSWPET